MASPLQINDSNSPLIKPVLLLLSLTGILLVSGCATVNLSDTVIGPDYIPSNVYTNAAAPVKPIRRVAVLPLTTSGNDINANYIYKNYQPVLMGELFKVKKFEVFEVNPDLLRELTGKKEWGAEEKLPVDFFTKLRDSTGCDAVIFPKVTVYKPYPPVAMGMNIKLVECESARILWSCDEVFDAGVGPVANSARRYYQTQLNLNAPGSDSKTILRTPRQFAQYVCYELLRRLPEWGRKQN
ncbi:MAG: hypothetical protein ACP5T0_09880 [Verrucomicrobiia bacterium]